MATEIPNFDTMAPAELMKFWRKYTRPRRKDAAALLGGVRPLYTVIASQLANYACNKATAISCRNKGDVQAAEIYERCCELIYDELPRDLRW